MVSFKGSGWVKPLLTGLSGLYVAVFLYMLVVRPGTEKSYEAFFNLYQAIPPAFAAVCGILTAWKGKNLPKGRRLGWLFVGLGCLSFATGQSIWYYLESVRGIEVPFPAASDFGYVGSYPFLLAGVLLLINSQPGVGRARHFLDSALATASLGMLSWTFIIAKTWAGATEQSLLAKLIGVAYPLGDIAVIFAATVAVIATSKDLVLRRAMSWVATGMVLVAFSDTAFSLLTMANQYKTGSPYDWGWSFGWLSIAWACMHVYWNLDKREYDDLDAKPSPKGEFVKVYGPYVAVFLSIAVLFGYDWATTHRLNFSQHTEVFWLLTLVVARQLFMVVENARLTRKVRTMNDNLEVVVSARTRQLESLQGLTKAVSSTLDVDKVVNEALINTRDVLDAEAVAVWLCGEDRDPSLPYASRGFDSRQETLDFIGRIEPDDGPVALGLGSEGGTGVNFVSAALVWQGNKVGKIAAAKWGGAFEEADHRLLESIGVVVGTALHNASQHATVVHAADRDPVTGLYNHRAFHLNLDRELRSARATGSQLSVIFLDLDNFKLFNDTYGHVVGDGVLKQVASILTDQAPQGSVVSRFGGDEFVLCVPGLAQDDAAALAKNVSQALQSVGYLQENDDRRIPIGASIGIAVYPLDGQNRHELLTTADRHLYDAKTNDDRIVMTSQEQRENRALRASESFETLDALVTAVDNKDRYTRKHSEEVTEYALWIAEEIGLSEESMRTLRVSGLLHDVGKIGVPDDILRKPGRLSPEEYEIMQRHPRLGELIVGAIPGMEGIVDGVRSHHERWDGQGYPDQLAGTKIPLLGRILAVADAFSAMTTDRPYRKGMDWSQALEIVQGASGTQFDPEMAAAFIKAVRKRGLDKRSERIAA